MSREDALISHAANILITLLASGAALAQTPQAASVPTAASPARHYERIAESKLPGLRAVRPTDFLFPVGFRKNAYGPRKNWHRAIPYQKPITADINSDGHIDFALIMKARHTGKQIAFHLVACLWRPAGYECRRIGSTLSGDRLIGSSLEYDKVTPDWDCLIDNKPWTGSALMIDPAFVGIRLVAFPYDKSTDSFRACEPMSD